MTDHRYTITEALLAVERAARAVNLNQTGSRAALRRALEELDRTRAACETERRMRRATA